MRIYFLSTYPFDTAPGQRFRYEQYIPFLKEKGHVVKHYSFLNESAWKILYAEGQVFRKGAAFFLGFMRRFSLMFALAKADFVFIFREAAPIGPPVFEYIISKILRKKIIYDFDDAIWLPNFSESNARFQRLKMYGKVKKIIKWSYQVVAGNQYLADYALQYNSNVKVIPTTIDTENVHHAKGNPDQEPLVIGWTGTHTTASYLPKLLPVLDELAQTTKFVFRIISNQDPGLDRSYVEYIPWTKEREIQDLATFNVGVMPLEDDIWSKGKCGFKGLQYMSLEIPAILSPVGVNTSIIKPGVNGFLCSDPDEWLSALQNLLQDKNLRKEIGQQGRKTVHEKYSVRVQKEHFLSLFKSQ